MYIIFYSIHSISNLCRDNCRRSTRRLWCTGTETSSTCVTDILNNLLILIIPDARVVCLSGQLYIVTRYANGWLLQLIFTPKSLNITHICSPSFLSLSNHSSDNVSLSPPATSWENYILLTGFLRLMNIFYWMSLAITNMSSTSSPSLSTPWT